MLKYDSLCVGRWHYWLIETIWHEHVQFLPFPSQYFLKANFSSHYSCLRGGSASLFTLTLFQLFWNLILLICFSPIFLFPWDCFPVPKQQQRLSQSSSFFYYLQSCWILSVFSWPDLLTQLSCRIRHFFPSYHFLAPCKTDFFPHHFVEAAFFLSFFLFFFFLMWTIFKVFIEFVTILLLFLCFGFLATRHVGS